MATRYMGIIAGVALPWISNARDGIWRAEPAVNLTSRWCGSLHIRYACLRWEVADGVEPVVMDLTPERF